METQVSYPHKTRGKIIYIWWKERADLKIQDSDLNAGYGVSWIKSAYKKTYLVLKLLSVYPSDRKIESR
jgi:hypothetical protein